MEIKRSQLGTRVNSMCFSLPNCKALESNCRGRNNGLVCRAWDGATWGTVLRALNVTFWPLAIFDFVLFWDFSMNLLCEFLYTKKFQKTTHLYCVKSDICL